ncbi:MAG: IS1595 family transposase [Pseudomonadota bacterium]
MSILSKKYFHDEAAAFEKLESVVWPDGPFCPHCGNAGKIYELKGVRSKPSKKHPEGVERHGLKKCGACRKQFTVRVGTVFESSHIPLHKWLQAAYAMSSSKKGVSAHQLHRALEITYKSAWFMAHRLREAMRSGSLAPFGGGGGIVEVDETYTGPRITRGTWGKKWIVLTLVDRDTGSARSFKVDKADKATILPILRENLDKEARVITDESSIYKRLDEEYTHAYVVHSKKQWGVGEIHTNTIEGFYSIFKRGMKGVYQHCSEKHLHRYAAEFDFRYSNRARLGIDDMERTDAALRGIVGKRLTYRRTDEKVNAAL